jgi:sugar phosphate isomerase/epimerase
MKLGVNTYSFLWNKSLEDSVKILGKNGFKGIEFLVSPPHFYLNEYRPGKYKELKKILDYYGMHVLSMNIPSLDMNAASPFPEMRQMTFELYKKMTDICLELDAEILLVLAGKRHPLLPPDFERIFAYCKDTLGKVVDYTRDTGLTIGIETCPALFVDKIAQLKRLVDELNDKRVKVVFDACNVFSQEDPAEAIKVVKDDLCLLHLSDTTTKKWEHNVLGTGAVDHAGFIKAAEEAGYDGYLVLEIINDQGIEGIKKSVQYLEQRGIKLPR